MIRRIAAAVATLVVATAMLSGCIGQPAPAESTPLFSSEDEAFAAAEQTYRNYVDALNQVDLSDPSTFEPVYAWTTGDANANARESYTRMHADGWQVSGESSLALVEPHPREAGDAGIYDLAVCLDVSDITGTDAEGKSVVSPDRRDVQSMLISLKVSVESPTKLLVSNIDGREGAPSCDRG
ncbi:hypothetical protein [Microbacterium sp. P03]|uniref:hypothetical protein n=1 Tax=Microbacterium sp. P03 TaxID=3366946 RepID=UPI0037458BF1